MPLPKCSIQRGSSFLSIWTGRFSYEFVAYVKEEVPSSHRDYDPGEKKWTVFAPYQAKVDKVLHNFFEIVARAEKPFSAEYERQQEEREWQQKAEQAEQARRKAWQQHQARPGGYGSAEQRFEEQQRQRNQGAPPIRPHPTSRDPYGILFITDKAPEEVIKAAWKACMLICHPDKNQHRMDWATEQSKAVNEAYQEIRKLKGF